MLKFGVQRGDDLRANAGFSSFVRAEMTRIPREGCHGRMYNLSRICTATRTAPGKVSNGTGTGDRHSVSSEFPRDDTDPATDIEQRLEEVCHIDVAVSPFRRRFFESVLSVVTIRITRPAFSVPGTGLCSTLFILANHHVSTL